MAGKAASWHCPMRASYAHTSSRLEIKMKSNLILRREALKSKTAGNIRRDITLEYSSYLYRRGRPKS
jgi:hypothetical protein